ncbi:6-phosphogluconolactonase [bacterium]|nr:6-phosphogluconolactonase [bacterium]MDB4445642.1 6-phosphogluconolactonase [bacterium]
MEIFHELAQLHEATAQDFCDLAKSSIESNGIFRVALSGGSTPKHIYELIAQRDLDWANIHWFWGDERNVPLDHPDSNARMVHEALLDRIDIPHSNIHEVPVNVDAPAEAARQYEQILRDHFCDAAFPTWDLALQGMGDDAHTASLFPETTALQEHTRWFVENWVNKLDSYRYTLTAPAINSAKQIWFMVSGEGKQNALKSVLSGPADPQLYPSQLINANRWLVTQDATDS